MLCPRCAANQNDDVKFCTSCGANLQAVREALGEPGKKFDWDDTWVAEMFMSGGAHKRRRAEMERRLGITPEVKRYHEIKAGVIVSSVGIGLALFLFFFMQGIAHNLKPEDAEIISRIWLAGIIPFMVGLALIINGLVVSKKMNAALEREQKHTDTLEPGVSPRGLRPAETSEFIPANLSVTDQTTRHLEHSERKIT
jgi:hypothetical protein